jgi:hypothetical protein
MTENINVRAELSTAPHREVVWGVVIKLHTFLTSTLDGRLHATRKKLSVPIGLEAGWAPVTENSSKRFIRSVSHIYRETGVQI